MIKLPDTKPDVFQTYLDWAYTGAFGIEYKWDKREAIDSTYQMLFKLYELGDFIDDPGLRYKALFQLVEHARGWPSPDIISDAWISAFDDSLLQRFIVSKLANRVDKGDFKNGMDVYPDDLMRELAKKLMDGPMAVMERPDSVSKWTKILGEHAVALLEEEEEREDDGGD